MKRRYNPAPSAQLLSPLSGRRIRTVRTGSIQASLDFSREKPPLAPIDEIGWTIAELHHAPESVKRLAIVAGVVDEEFFDRAEPVKCGPEVVNGKEVTA